eukprot:TRINITY_DN11388_c0_g1_i3.p1 TRINITY_DN11388_c0_g1~~TRINITY_DN11388_c0_g1_i3.p1  ORF type:complete len:206 (+),score=23.03 TRINITY_DN11388_c0_g1_i3:70-618(+)
MCIRDRSPSPREGRVNTSPLKRGRETEVDLPRKSNNDTQSRNTGRSHDANKYDAGSRGAHSLKSSSPPPRNPAITHVSNMPDSPISKRKSILKGRSNSPSMTQMSQVEIDMDQSRFTNNKSYLNANMEEIDANDSYMASSGSGRGRRGEDRTPASRKRTDNGESFSAEVDKIRSSQRSRGRR